MQIPSIPGLRGALLLGRLFKGALLSRVVQGLIAAKESRMESNGNVLHCSRWSAPSLEGFVKHPVDRSHRSFPEDCRKYVRSEDGALTDYFPGLYQIGPCDGKNMNGYRPRGLGASRN